MKGEPVTRCLPRLRKRARAEKCGHEASDRLARQTRNRAAADFACCGIQVRYHWTSPLREALVRSVEKREKLWKKYPVISHDTDLRAKLWGEVADELSEQFGVLIDTEDMKKTWKNLKDNYWRIIKTFDTEPERAKRWKFYDAMRFMERANTDDSQRSYKSHPDPHSLPSSSRGRPMWVITLRKQEEFH
ncbi:unnamed protein product [Strongylus vulgaris]|uniref:MADF domain-containing protein n=1 Tax=Strongylus vulgaris TaxID=40348 RepID=A0A3P7JRZ4_STRVU|nr:unnamed protein product [Strongylus vulgaris]